MLGEVLSDALISLSTGFSNELAMGRILSSPNYSDMVQTLIKTNDKLLNSAVGC